MTVEAEVIAIQSVNATHWWEGAFKHGTRKYLAHPHQHRFLIEVRAPVSHDDRQIEFHDLRDELLTWINYLPLKDNVVSFGPRSCEMIGKDIMAAMPQVHWVRVMEDAEHGAITRRV